MGCGKTVIGKCLAKRKSLDFIDLDEFIETEENTSISKLFEKGGELGFRKKERFYLENLLSQNLQAIISLGGGTPCYFENINYIIQKEAFQTVYLKTSIPILVNRLKGQNLRPLVNDKNITNALIDIFDRREILYEKTANVQIDTDDKTIEDITFNLKEKLIIEEN